MAQLSDDCFAGDDALVPAQAALDLILPRLTRVTDSLSLPLVGPDFSLLGRGLPAALLLAGVVAAEHAGVLRVPGALVWLGELSYALYLTHPTVIETVATLLVSCPSLAW